MFILKKGHQPGVYVPLRALFLVSTTFNSRCSVPFKRFLALNNMYVVLSKLMGNLFRLLQYMICNRSAEISSFIVFISVLLVCTVASSANKSQKQCFKHREVSRLQIGEII